MAKKRRAKKTKQNRKAKRRKRSIPTAAIPIHYLKAWPRFKRTLARDVARVHHLRAFLFPPNFFCSPSRRGRLCRSRLNTMNRCKPCEQTAGSFSMALVPTIAPWNLPSLVRVFLNNPCYRRKAGTPRWSTRITALRLPSNATQCNYLPRVKLRGSRAEWVEPSQTTDSQRYRPWAWSNCSQLR